MMFGTRVRLRFAAGTAVMAGLVFLSAGRLDFWQGWVYVLVNLSFFGLTAWVLRREHGLIAERLRPGRGMKWWDKGYYLLATPLSFGAIVVAGIDAGRRRWGPPPRAGLYLAAVAVYVAGQALFLWAKKVNPFFSSVVRLQADRGQTVCREGPYRFCRHPGYLAGLMFGLATPLVLGSFWALVPQALAAAALVGRTFLEDRMLTKDLLWYAEYRQSVRFRLLPGVW